MDKSLLGGAYIHLRHTTVLSCYQKVYIYFMIKSIISLCNLRYVRCLWKFYSVYDD